MGFLATNKMKTIAILFIDFWRKFISPLYSWIDCCKYTPSCSKYARDSYIMHGFIKGTLLSIGRILRCNPFSNGGIDPCPENYEINVAEKIRSIKNFIFGIYDWHDRQREPWNSIAFLSTINILAMGFNGDNIYVSICSLVILIFLIVTRTFHIYGEND